MASRTFNAPKVHNASIFGFLNADKNIVVTSVRADTIWEIFVVFSTAYGAIIRGSGTNTPLVTTIYGTPSFTATANGNQIILSGLNPNTHHIVIGGYGIEDIQQV